MSKVLTDEELYDLFFQLYPEFNPDIEWDDFLIAKAMVINKICAPSDPVLLCAGIAHMCILRFEKLQPRLASKILVDGRSTKNLKVGEVSGAYVNATNPADEWWFQTPYGLDVYQTCANGGTIGVYAVDECGCGCG